MRCVMDSFEKMYSVKEAAALLSWSQDTVRRLIYRGHLTAVVLPKMSGGQRRICRSARIRERDIKQFLDSPNAK